MTTGLLDKPLAVPQAVNWRGLFWFALAILSALPLFWYGLTGLAEAWARPEYSHGPVIPLLSFYMFLHEMKAVPPASAPVTDRWPGVALVGAALALALVGNLVQITDLVFYALILWVGGLILVGFGWARGHLFWPSVLHLVFMLPLPQFLQWKVNTGLQHVSSELGVTLVALAGVPVYLDGNVIDLGIYKLQVAEACSGLRYLFPIMSFTYVFAVLYRGPRWIKAVLLLSAIPLAVAMNAVRIGIIGILVDRYGIAQAEGFLHVFEGWAIFLACIAILFGMAKAMQRLSGDRRPLGAALDMDFSGLGTELGRVRAIPPSAGMIAVAGLTAALSAGWLLAPSQAPTLPDRDPFSLFPRQVGAWSGTGMSLSPEVEKVLGADDYLAAWYQSPGDPEGVDFFMSYYRVQTDGDGIHSPEVCLPGSGWEMFAIGPRAITLPAPFGTITVNRAVIQKGLEKQLVYYWFEGRGRRLTGDFAAKLYTIADGLRTGRSDGGLVRVITPIAAAPDGSSGEAASEAAAEAAADARLQAFLAAVAGRLPRFIPE